MVPTRRYSIGRTEIPIGGTVISGRGSEFEGIDPGRVLSSSRSPSLSVSRERASSLSDLGRYLNRGLQGSFPSSSLPLSLPLSLSLRCYLEQQRSNGVCGGCVVLICRSVGRSRVQERGKRERERGRGRERKEEGGREGAAPLGNLSRGNGGEMIRRLRRRREDGSDRRPRRLSSLPFGNSVTRGIDPGLRTTTTITTCRRLIGAAR